MNTLETKEGFALHLLGFTAVCKYRLRSQGDIQEYEI